MPHRPTAPWRRVVARSAPAALILAIVALAFGAASAQAPDSPGAPTAEPSPGGALIATETVAEIRIHGNLSLPDAEVIALAGVDLGDAAGSDLEETVRVRLAASGRFETVDVRRRYRSLTATMTRSRWSSWCANAPAPASRTRCCGRSRQPDDGSWSLPSSTTGRATAWRTGC